MAPEVSGLVLRILVRGIQKSNLKLECRNWAKRLGEPSVVLMRGDMESIFQSNIANSYNSYPRSTIPQYEIFLIYSSPDVHTLGGERYSPPEVDRKWGIWGSYYNIPKTIFYLLKGDDRLWEQPVPYLVAGSKPRSRSGSPEANTYARWFNLLLFGILYMGFPKIRGTFLGLPIIRTIVYWGLYWGTLILGNYHMRGGSTCYFSGYFICYGL